MDERYKVHAEGQASVAGGPEPQIDFPGFAPQGGGDNFRVEIDRDGTPVTIGRLWDVRERRMQNAGRASPVRPEPPRTLPSHRPRKAARRGSRSQDGGV